MCQFNLPQSGSRSSLLPMSVATASRQVLSAVHRGTAFETRALGLLQNNLSMSLTSVAGRGDGGVDLIGWWWLPHDDDGGHDDTGIAGPSKPRRGTVKMMEVSSFETRRKIRVLVQCKAEKKRIGPKYIRELEGVAARYVYDELHRPPPHLEETQPSEPIPIVAALVSSSSFTKASVLRALSSPIPMLLMHLPSQDDNNGGMASDSDDEGTGDLIGSAILNPPLSSIRQTTQNQGMGGSKLELRWERSLLLNGTDASTRIGMWWGGRRVPNWVPRPSYS
ncbi:hypothetical protein FRB94_000415 [Tulasnella sp. JGI-2019a]|nr:hypothetical protein FRB94_000415 [Tulasnella sp. JGI-2019a]